MDALRPSAARLASHQTGGDCGTLSQSTHFDARPHRFEDQCSLSTMSESTSGTLEHDAYRRFHLYHCIALLPTLIILLVSTHASLRARSLCALQTIDRTHNARSVPISCNELLDSHTFLLCLTLGVTVWLATFASRRASWFLSASLVEASFSVKTLQGPGRWIDPQRLVVALAVLLQSLLTEALRLFSFYLASCILLARLHERLDAIPSAVLAGNDQADDTPAWAWRASFHDPRFFIALWVSLAWSMLEFLSGSYQILRQLSLYRPDAESEGTFKFDNTSAWSKVSFGRRSAHDEEDVGESRGSRARPRPRFGRVHSLSRTATSEAPSGGTLTPVSDGKLRSKDELSSNTSIRPAQRSHPNYGATGWSQQVRRADGTVEPADGAHRLDIAIDEDHGSSSSFTDSNSTASSELDSEIEDQVQQLLLAKERAEVEGVLGAPLPSISVALCSLWRVDAMLWSMGSGLLLSAIFAHSQGSLGKLTKHGFTVSVDFSLFPAFHEYAATFGFLVVLHAAISALWATSLPTMGFASATYSSLLVGISLLLAGLARWGFLV